MIIQNKGLFCGGLNEVYWLCSKFICVGVILNVDHCKSNLFDG